MEILHKSGPLNIIPDALSRLLEKWDDEDEEEGILDIDAFFAEQAGDPLRLHGPVERTDKSHPYGKWHSKANKHANYAVQDALQAAIDTPMEAIVEICKPEPGEFPEPATPIKIHRAYVEDYPEENNATNLPNAPLLRTNETEAELPTLAQIPLKRGDLNPKDLPRRLPTLKDHPLYNEVQRMAMDDNITLLESQGGKTTEPAYITEAFKAIVVELSDEFKAKLKRSYSEDNSWDKVFKALADMPKEEEDVPTGVGFKLRNGLIYHLDEEGRERLCIPKDIE